MELQINKPYVEFVQDVFENNTSSQWKSPGGESTELGSWKASSTVNLVIP